MLICDYYRGCTDKLTGHLYDTEKKTFKKFSIKGDIWTVHYRDGLYLRSKPKETFKVPADIEYYFKTQFECECKISILKTLGFIEDQTMELDFGCVVL